VTIDLKTLEVERDALKAILRDVEAEQRLLETQKKSLRQKEMRTKRKLEAIQTLIDIGDPTEPEQADAALPAPG
jgi:hypothetical protein